jgi:hypothetical protein
MTTKLKPVRLIYVGNRYGYNTQKIFQAFIVEGEKPEVEHLFTIKKSRTLNIGDIYEGETSGGPNHEKLIKKGAVVGQVENHNRIVEWCQKSIANDEIYRKQKAIKKIEKMPLPKHIIDELRDHLKNLTYRERHAFVEYLTSELS